MSLKLQHPGKRSHRGAADADEVDVFASLHDRKAQA
jgi:hypothetical protein